MPRPRLGEQPMTPAERRARRSARLAEAEAEVAQLRAEVERLRAEIATFVSAKQD